MKVLLEGLLPRLFPDLNFLCIAHEGKQDLRSSLTRKLRAWRDPGVRFCVILDNDGEKCTDLKQSLVEQCALGGRRNTLVRIVCQELEAWYLGAPDSLASAFGDEQLRGIGAKARYRSPDHIVRPSDELTRLVPEYQKLSGAMRMAKTLTRTSNSQSYRVLIEGIDHLAKSMRTPQGDK